MAADASVESILDVAENADGLLVTYAKITAEVIAGLNNCKVIGRFGIGVDTIDLAAAAAARITVTYAPVHRLLKRDDVILTPPRVLFRGCIARSPDNRGNGCRNSSGRRRAEISREGTMTRKSRPTHDPELARLDRI